LPAGPGEEGALSASALSPDGKRLAVTGFPLGRGKHGILIYILSLVTGQLEQVLKGHTGTVPAMVFSGDGRFLYTASNDKTARAFDLRTGRSSLQFVGHRDRLRALAVSSDDRWLATACLDRRARIWSTENPAQFVELTGHTKEVISVAFSPDNRTVATGSVDGTIRLWALDGMPKKSPEDKDTKGHALQVTSLN